MNIRICALKLWLLLHVAALNLHLCSSKNLEGNGTTHVVLVEGIGTPEAAPSSEMEDAFWSEHDRRRYFYAHNETKIAMARAEAEAQNHDAGGASARTSVLRSATFPDFAPPEDGCLWDSVGAQDLSFFDRNFLEMSNDNGAIESLMDEVQILAVDSCSGERNVRVGNKPFEICSRRWVREKPETILIKDDPSPLTRSFKVLVKIRTMKLEVIADGVYFPATGTMHLVGCARGQEIFPEERDVPRYTRFVSRWKDPDDYYERPLNSSIFQNCNISATLQYPPLKCRWNSDRVLKYSLRSNRAKDDPLYFAPIERSAFLPYLSNYYNSERPIRSQRRLETGGRLVLLVLGLVCVALQIEHGRKHKESLPYVSLVMLAIQLAHHLSQTSIFKDLQIGRYNVGNSRLPDGHKGNSLLDSIAESEYYATMAWREHVPYQAMAMAAIFMYVWVFHNVGERRRIMQLRVIRNRPGAKDPPSDWHVTYTTLALFAIVLFLGFVVIGADHDGYFRRELTGMTTKDDRYYRFLDLERKNLAPPNYEDVYSPGFVSSRLYELSQAQWGFVNRLAGLVVSFFLVPQLLGNREWQAHGQHPLSAWFYAGIPFLQSLPHVFSIAKHFQLLPIFPLFDPYINSVFGVFENSTPWWRIAVVLCSSLQVLAVHLQFSRSLIRGSRQYSRDPKASTHDVAQSLDVL